MTKRKGRGGRTRKNSERKENACAPESMGWFLSLLRESAGLSTDAMAKRLRHTPGRGGISISQTTGARPKKLTKNVINNAERGLRVEPWLMTRYANWSGLPVAAINLIQQLASHIRDEDGNNQKRELALAIARGVINVCEKLIESVERSDLSAVDPQRQGLILTLLEREPDPDKRAKLERFLSSADELLSAYPEESRHLLIEDAKRMWPVQAEPFQDD